MKKKTELELLYSFKDMIEAYEEIASIRMQRVKDSVLANRSFLEGMRAVYHIVTSNYIQDTYVKTWRTKKVKQALARKTNGKELAVLLSSNTGLYGDIIKETFFEFVSYAKNRDVELAIVGNTGKSLYETYDKGSQNKKKAFYFPLSDTFEDKKNLETLIEFVAQFEKINVFHGQYKTMLSQFPSKTVISGDSANSVAEDLQNKEKMVKDMLATTLPTSDAEAKEGVEGALKNKDAYLFEPNITAVLSFFETEILSSMLEHTVHESSLSKFASRMISLDRATNKVDERIQVGKLAYQKSRHSESSRKQLNQLSSIYGRIKHAA